MKTVFYFLSYVWRVGGVDEHGTAFRISIRCAWNLAKIHTRKEPPPYSMARFREKEVERYDVQN